MDRNINNIDLFWPHFVMAGSEVRECEPGDGGGLNISHCPPVDVGHVFSKLPKRPLQHEYVHPEVDIQVGWDEGTQDHGNSETPRAVKWFGRNHQEGKKAAESRVKSRQQHRVEELPAG